MLDPRPHLDQQCERHFVTTAAGESSLRKQVGAREGANRRGRVHAAFEEGPVLVLIETPSNPLMRVVDVAALSTQARAAVAVDNTFLSSALQRPIALGADYVIHSTTKYLNGHSDVIGGAVVIADPAVVEELRHWGNVVGSAGAPFDPRSGAGPDCRAGERIDRMPRLPPRPRNQTAHGGRNPCLPMF
jgi:hypothetical protein